ncbi:MAG: 30S ribosomal protein S6 [bacterium]
MAVTYETIFVLDPSLNDDAITKLTEKIAAFIQEREGNIIKQENWGKQKFTYEIKKKNEGTYIFFNYAAPPTIVDDMRRFLKYEEAVLRNITTKVEAVKRSRFIKKQKKEEAVAGTEPVNPAPVAEEAESSG